MPILQRYLLRTFTPLFSLCMGVFLFVLLMNYFLRLFNLAVMQGIPLMWIFLCFTRLLPYLLSLALPMAFVLALLLTLGQLTESGEILAMRASGFSFMDILGPFLAAAFGCTLLLLHINHKASPDGFHSFRESYTRAAAQASRLNLDERSLTQLGDWDVFAEQVERGGGALEGIRLVKRKGEYARLRISAPEGRMRVEPERGLRLELLAGSLVWPSKDPLTSTTSTFQKARLFIPFRDHNQAPREPDIPELSTRRLMERLAALGDDPQKAREYTTEKAMRSASALAPLVLFLVATPLGMVFEKRGRALGFALSLLLLFAYYGLLAVGVGIGRRHLAWSPWGPWLPDAACLACGALLWWGRMRR
ncbi:MAG: hypothetical protein A2X36_04410 [Elusimicrobia bacterium GWA2_69_24]|nr:MAG: hypothetical protein A2X36_04410 [Elusimicrobia bacterium GWA2_69_24]HBL18597.1 hypothetical protein [Elusimicrobiota bacterium]